MTKILSHENIWTFFARVNPNDFTLAGLQKYCKWACSITNIGWVA